MRFQTFAPSDIAKLLRRSGFDGNSVFADFQSIRDRTSFMAAMCGPIRGASVRIVMSALLICPPRLLRKSWPCARKTRESAPFIVITWWEMLPDVAFAQRTQNCICEGMECCIGIRMPLQFRLMRNLHAAERHVFPWFELVNVYSMSEANI